MKISYGKNVYGKEEINAVLNKLNKTTHMGDAVTSFENKIAKLFSKKYGLMVNSGSSALMLATNVLNFKGKKKWDFWNKLRGKDKDWAKNEYVKFYLKLRNKYGG